MKLNKKPITFLVAVVISLAAAHHRWGDSGHAMGIVSASGGSARHPVVLSSGKSRYSQVITATVVPPYRGDAKISFSGPLPVDYDIYHQSPVLDFGLTPAPYFEDDILHELNPGNRLTLWLVVRPANERRITGRYELGLDDVASGKRVLTIPILFSER